MARLTLFLLATILCLGAEPAAAASVVARVDLSQQTMRVYIGGSHRHTWRVSTGRGRYRTPTGSWSVKFLKRMHYSSKYNNSPMPFSVFSLKDMPFMEPIM